MWLLGNTRGFMIGVGNGGWGIGILIGRFRWRRRRQNAPGGVNNKVEEVSYLPQGVLLTEDPGLVGFEVALPTRPAPAEELLT
jgi:hypothetical protein